MSLKIKKMLVMLAMMIALPFVCGSECDTDPVTKLPRLPIATPDYSSY